MGSACFRARRLARARKTKQPAVAVPNGPARFYAAIRRIPRGRVTTYGAIAALSGLPRAARQVGFALARAFGPAERRLPWHRVLGAQGHRHAHVTIADPAARARQRALLEAEGVRFDDRGRGALAEFGWPARRK